MDAVRVGFIGCGKHSGARLYPSLRSAGLELVAVCDVDAAKATARAAEYNLKAFYTDYNEMCRSENMHAVLVSIGPQPHYELALALLAKGYHVWTEKPCSATAAQADEIAQAAEKAGRLVQTGFNYRYTLGIQKAKSMIESGRFATPSLVAVRWWLGVPNPVEFWHHYMVHAVDLLYYISGGGLSGIRHAEHVARDGFDYYLAVFRGANDCIATLELSANMAIQGHWSRVDWMSRDGMLSVRDFSEVTHYQTALWGRYARPDLPAYDGDRIWRTEPLIAKGPFVDVWGYVTELTRFREAIQGKRAPEATIKESAWGMHVCEELLKVAGVAVGTQAAETS